MTFAEQLCEAAWYEAAAWSLALRLEWRQRGWPLPEHWPYSLGHARRFLRLPPSVDPAVTSWLAQLVDAGARMAWSRQETVERPHPAPATRSRPEACRRSA